MKLKIASLALAAAMFAGAVGTVVAQAPKNITMGTAGPGSIVYVWVSSLSNALDTIAAPVRVQVNAGVFDTEAMRVINAGGAGVDSSFVGGSSLAAAGLGTGPFEGQPLQNIRGAFPLGQAPVAIVTRADAGIRTLRDLEGKRISAGPAGIGNDVFMRGFMAKVAPDMNVQVVPVAHAAFATALQDRRLDAIFMLGWPPFPAAVEAGALMELHYIKLDEADINTWIAENPQHHPMVMKAGMNPQQDEDISTLGHVSHLILGASMDEEVVYELTKAWLREDVRKMLLDTSSTWEAAFMALDEGLYFRDLEGLNVKLHKGAVRALEEGGFDVPQALKD